MKKLICLLMAALCMLAACGCEDGENVQNFDLVFVNNSDFTIVAVVANFEDRGSGVQHADSSPMKTGETFGFEAGEYPVTVAVYDRPAGDFEQRELGTVTIQKAPPEGERWYVTAREGASGLVLTADLQWPEGV